MEFIYVYHTIFEKKLDHKHMNTSQSFRPCTFHKIKSMNSFLLCTLIMQNQFSMSIYTIKKKGNGSVLNSIQTDPIIFEKIYAEEFAF